MGNKNTDCTPKSVIFARPNECVIKQLLYYNSSGRFRPVKPPKEFFGQIQYACLNQVKLLSNVVNPLTSWLYWG